jgi:hypothetical protein
MAITHKPEDSMVKKKRGWKRSTQCHLRSECKAKSNQRYFEKLLAKDWDHMVVKLDSSTGEYKLSTV